MPPGPDPAALLRKHERKLRFILVGAWNTVFGYFVFLLLHNLLLMVFSTRQMAYMIAMVLSFVVSVLNAFVWHKVYTFQSRARGMALLRELARFSSTYISVLVLSLLLLPIFVEIFGFSPKLAGALVILVCTAISYFGHSRFSFRKTSP